MAEAPQLTPPRPMSGMMHPGAAGPRAGFIVAVRDFRAVPR